LINGAISSARSVAVGAVKFGREGGKGGGGGGGYRKYKKAKNGKRGITPVIFNLGTRRKTKTKI